MTGMNWIKLFPTYVDNPSLGILPEAIQVRWYKLYMLAGLCDAEGKITLPHQEIAWKLHISTEELQATYEILYKANPDLFSNNGDGPKVPIFNQEQVDKETRNKKAEDNRIRQASFRDKHKRISNALVTPQESESESEFKSQSQESEVKESVVSQSPGKTDDDRVHTLTEIFKLCGVPQKYRNIILTIPSITREDVLAELARNYSRKGSGKGTVQQPGWVTGMNLAKCERPPAEWYEPSMWTSHLPDVVIQKLGLVTQSDEDSFNSGSLVATRNIEIPIAIEMSIEENAWQAALGQLQLDMPKGSYQSHVRDTHLVSYADGVFTVAVANAFSRDWLEQRMTSTVTRILAGIMNREVSIRFVVEEGA